MSVVEAAVIDRTDRRVEAQRRAARCVELESELRALAGHINALQARFLSGLREYDQLQGWAEWGARSATDWLSNHCGHSTHLAKTELALCERLAHLPAIASAMAGGGLSMDKARALAAVATADTEAELLALATEATASQLTRALAAAHRALGAAEADRLRRARHLHTWWDDDGMLAVRGRLTPEEGALFRKALGAAKEALYREQRSAGFEEGPPAPGEPDDRPDPAATANDPAGARWADAVVAMAHSYLEHGPAQDHGDHYQVIIHIDAETLVDDGDGRCHIEAGPALSAEVVDRLACGASLVWLATDQAGHPVAVSDRTPNIPTSIRRAVRARDQGCVFPTGNGSRCGLAPPYCDVHHVVYRSDGGRHTVDNCRMLCRFHHHLVHEGGFGLSVADDGTLQARRPDGSPLPNRPPPPPDPDGVPPPPHLDLETDIAWARSNGERMELATTVDVLLYGIGLRTS